MSDSLPLVAPRPRLTAIASQPVGTEILGFAIEAIKESGPLRLINRHDFHRHLVNAAFFQRWIDERHPAALRAFIVFDVRREANVLFVAMCLVRDGGRWDDWPDYLSVLSGAREVTLPIRVTDADVELLRASVPRLVHGLKTGDPDDLKNHQHEWLQPRFGPNVRRIIIAQEGEEMGIRQAGVGRPPRFVDYGSEDGGTLLFWSYTAATCNRYGTDVLLRDFTCRQSIRIGLSFSFRSPLPPPPNGVCLTVLRFLANQARPLTPTYAAQLERPPVPDCTEAFDPWVWVLPEGDDGPPCVVSLLRGFQRDPVAGATLDIVMTSLISPQQWPNSPVDHPGDLEGGDRDLPFVTPTSVVAHVGAGPDGVECIAWSDGAGASVAPVLSFIHDQLNTSGRRLVHQGVIDLLTFVSGLRGSFPNEDNVAVEKCFLLHRPEAIHWAGRAEG
ncbi:unnamed protein product [Vitrella brassicaformis CCMP3155]|uniref:Uncharacterized protein n=1 Tax=Vitrella brassicaformis (strain CCMP3155) TaxID=1169540 RepID=A0A0G4FZS3_VITBC|nr:unnamed protein product [Vitrella brassicaformis CCMP3155]|eukprot:CEM21039.1 unnamed protein product [Vitrella brassicaformis CCMP3155]